VRAILLAAALRLSALGIVPWDCFCVDCRAVWLRFRQRGFRGGGNTDGGALS
jgi:hypothetical protein